MIVVFDCDGTLVDSQHAIHAALAAAFRVANLTPPTPAQARAIVGLSLEQAMDRLLAATGQQGDARRLAGHYREAFLDIRARSGGRPGFEPLFPGVRPLLAKLRDHGCLLGIATGKSRRGLLATLERHDLGAFFDAWATADDHPSKPHPAMLEAVVDALGGTCAQAIHVGDTRFDMEMAVAAGVTPVGVAWGYHDQATLKATGARVILDHPQQLLALVQRRANGAVAGPAARQERAE